MYFTQVAGSEIDFTNARQSVHFKSHPVALLAPARTALTDLSGGPEQPTHEREQAMTTMPPALTAAIDQAYEGTKHEHADMVTEVRKQIAEGLGREDIITGHMLFLTMRYNAAQLAALVALLTYEEAKDQA